MNNGELFESFIDWFKSILIILEEPENRQYFKNALLNMNYKIEQTITQNMYEERVKSRFFEMISHINSENSNIKNEQEIYHIIKIMMAVMFQNLVHVCAKELPINEAMKVFSLEINLLRKGFYRGT